MLVQAAFELKPRLAQSSSSTNSDYEPDTTCSRSSASPLDSDSDGQEFHTPSSRGSTQRSDISMSEVKVERWDEKLLRWVPHSFDELENLEATASDITEESLTPASADLRTMLHDGRPSPAAPRSCAPPELPPAPLPPSTAPRAQSSIAASSQPMPQCTDPGTPQRTALRSKAAAFAPRASFVLASGYAAKAHSGWDQHYGSGYGDRSRWAIDRASWQGQKSWKNSKDSYSQHGNYVGWHYYP